MGTGIAFWVRAFVLIKVRNEPLKDQPQRTVTLFMKTNTHSHQFVHLRMRTFLAAILAIAVSIHSGFAQIVINEIDADTSGSDKLEFVELYDGGAGATSLDGMVIVFFNGSNGGSRGAYRVFDLDGLSTDAKGYFLLANPNVAGIGALVAANTGMTFDPGGSGALQNGEDAVGVYSGLDDTDIELDTQPYTTPQDIELGNGVTLLDAVVYQTSRNAGASPDSDSGFVGEFGITGGVLDENLTEMKDTASLARVPDGGNALDQSPEFWTLLESPTPGYANEASGELDLIFTQASVSEAAGAGALEVSIFRDSTDGALLVSFSGNDPSELAFPSSVTIPDGQESLVFTVNAVDDGAADGTQTVTITATAPDFFESIASVDVTDDGDAPTLVLNEIYAEVEDGHDTNFDGVTNFVGDEFIELVNISGAILDITGWVVSDNERVRHVFPAGSVLDIGCAAVVFGGGQFTDGVRADFGNALVQKASTGGLGLNDGGDAIEVSQAGIERAGAAFDDYNAPDGDLTRSPELTGDFVAHGLAGAGTLFSPGTQANGSNFCDIAEILSLTGSASVAENAGANALTFTLARSGSTTGAITVQLGSSDVSEAVFQLTSIEIPDGSPSVTVSLDAIDDAFVDGDQVVELAAHAVGFVSAFTPVTVSDAGGDTGRILINEVDSDTPGTDLAEFIELYDGGVGGVRLDGYVVALFDGNSGLVYDVYDLDGFSTNANGFFVIGAPGVPNVDLTDLPFGGGILQGGPDALAIYVGNAADHFVGSAPSGTPEDAVTYGSFDDGDALSSALGLSGQVGDDSPSKTIARLPDGGNRLDLSGFSIGEPTPGASNTGDINDTPYDTWAAGFSGLGSRLDDADDDGLVSIVEYALGKNPLTPDRDGAPSGMLVGGQMQLSITKGSEGGADPALSYVVEVSSDLQNWSTNDTSVLTDDAATLVVAYSGSETRIYMRLRVELQ